MAIKISFKMAEHIYILSLLYAIMILKFIGLIILYAYILKIEQYFSIVQEMKDNDTLIGDHTVSKQISIVMWSFMSIMHEVISTIFSIFASQ